MIDCIVLYPIPRKELFSGEVLKVHKIEVNILPEEDEARQNLLFLLKAISKDSNIEDFSNLHIAFSKVSSNLLIKYKQVS